jgi:hypothetical protein
MAITIQPVQPGDLITASFFNEELIKHIEDLDARVAALEEGVEGSPPTAPGAVFISAVTPAPVREGEDLVIVGGNFGFSIGAHRVRFDGIQPPAFRAGSNDNVLICQVPELPVDPPDTGAAVTLTVNNATSTATRTITVLPVEVTQAGNVDMDFRGASPDPLTAGVPNEFEFRLDSDAPLPATLTITPTVTTPAGGPLGWATAVLDDAHAVIADRRVTVVQGTPETIFVRVDIPGGTNGTAFRLPVAAEGGGISSSAGVLEFTVGQNADPDTDIMLSPSTGVTGATISATTGTFKTVHVEADFAADGDYNVSLTPMGGLTNWTTAMLSPTSDNPVISIDADDRAPDGIADRTIQFRVRPNSGATDGQLRLTVQRTGATKSRSFTFDMDVT